MDDEQIVELVMAMDSVCSAINPDHDAPWEQPPDKPMKKEGIEKRRARHVRGYPVDKSPIYQLLKEKTGKCQCSQLRTIICLMEKTATKPTTVSRIEWRWKGGLIRWLDNNEERALEAIEANWDQLG